MRERVRPRELSPGSGGSDVRVGSNARRCPTAVDSNSDNQQPTLPDVCVRKRRMKVSVKPSVMSWNNEYPSSVVENDFEVSSRMMLCFC